MSHTLSPASLRKFWIPGNIRRRAPTLTPDASIFLSQLIGASLYWIDRDRYYSYMAFTKQNFALVTTMMTQLWGPTLIRISGDPDVASQIQRLDDGTVEFNFPERLVLIANHQVRLDLTPSSLLARQTPQVVDTNRSIRTGSTSGGLVMQTNHGCMAASILFSRSLCGGFRSSVRV